MPNVKAPARIAAITAGDKFYIATKPCRNGHANAKRYATSGACYQCVVDTHKIQRADSVWQAQDSIKQKAFRILHKARLSRKETLRSRKRKGLPEPTRPDPSACECCGLVPTKKNLGRDHDHTPKHSIQTQ